MGILDRLEQRRIEKMEAEAEKLGQWVVQHFESLDWGESFEDDVASYIVANRIPDEVWLKMPADAMRHLPNLVRLHIIIAEKRGR